MKDETMRSESIRGAKLPDDFARRVIAQARREQSERRVRFRVAVAACATLIVAVISMTRTRDLLRHNLDAPDSSAIAWQSNSQDDSDNAIDAASAQLAAAAAPDDVSDYLMPNARQVGNFANYAADASWQYDPD